MAGSTALAMPPLLAAEPVQGQALALSPPPQGTPSQETDPLWRWDAVDLAAAIAARQVSGREATASCLERLGAVNPRVNAVVEALADEALAAADLADRVVAGGVPVTAKINVDMRGHATTNGAVACKGRIAAEDSSPVRNLRRAGAVIFGKGGATGDRPCQT